MKDGKLIKPGKWYTEFDENGSCTAAVYEESYRDLLGYESEKESGNAQELWAKRIHPDDLERVEAHLVECIGKHPEGMDFDIEYRMTTKWGYRWFHDYAHIVRREDGSVIRADGVVFDIQDIVKTVDEHELMSENYLRIFALEDNFEVLYDVELATGRYDIFVKGQTFGDVNNNLINNNSFFDDVEKNLKVVHPDDRQGNFDTTRPDFIREALSKDDHFDRYYRLMVDGKPAWARMRIVYKDSEKKNIIIGVFNAENDVEAKQIAEQKELLEVQQKQLREALSFTNFFLDTYISAYYINLDDGSYQVYKRTELLNKKYPVVDDYYTSMKDYIKQDVHPDDRAELIEIMAPESLRKILNESSEYSYYYRSVLGGAERTIRLHIIRGADEKHAAFGFIDVTDELREQQKRILGAMPLSNDVLTKANIGLWAFELDDGKLPRMYVDDTMLGLLGLEHQVSPEETYHAWYDHIDEGSYDLCNDAVAKMASGEHAEVQYPWHYPNGRTIIVRCGGVRNFEYTMGIRIEGTHQDVTQTLHFDEEERQRAKQIENDLIVSKLRADSLAYISDNDPDLDNAINFFGQRILEISGCDQVIFREMNGHRIVRNAPGINDISLDICDKCPFNNIENEVYGEDGIVLMNNCREGCHGVSPHPDCPAKSSFMQRIYSGGELVGLLTVHYLNDYHTFSENGIGVMKIVAVYLGLLIGRIKEKQANIARLEAESSNKAKTEFLFNMSHDIRTPMNAILGYTNIALNHVNNPDRVNDSLKKIKTSGGHLLNLINDILEMSRIEAGRMEIINTPVNIHEVSEGVIHMSQALAANKDIEFIASIGDLKNPYIYADELHTNQVIINLISNAIKYTNPGGTVEYSIEQISDAINSFASYRVTVKDNGIGMSEEFQKHLFESFAREQTATVSKQEGAGLGLAIVKNIIDLIGGTISIESKQGVGSTVVVELPLEVMDEESIKNFVNSHDVSPEFGLDLELQGRKVLLVEDNELNREIAVDILTEEGLFVEEAEDGTVAVELLKTKGPDYYDFILMDIQMPVMNGYEATREIRKMYPDSKIPIIALSANAFSEDREKSIAAGMDEHVAKPIEIGELFKALGKFV